MENVHCIWDQVLRPISSQLRAHITHQFTKRIAFDIHVKNMQEMNIIYMCMGLKVKCNICSILYQSFVMFVHAGF